MGKTAIPIMTGIAAGVVWAAVGPRVSVGKIPYGEIALYGSRFLAGPIAFVSMLLLVIPPVRRSLLMGIGLGVSMFLLVSLIGVSRANKLKRIQNSAAKDYCQELIHRLEAYKGGHGDYPEKIDTLLPTNRNSLPIYLRDGTFYFKGTNTFSLGWSDSPRFWICSGVSRYDHNTGQWHGCADW